MFFVLIAMTTAMTSIQHTKLRYRLASKRPVVRRLAIHRDFTSSSPYNDPEDMSMFPGYMSQHDIDILQSINAPGSTGDEIMNIKDIDPKTIQMLSNIVDGTQDPSMITDFNIDPSHIIFIYDRSQLEIVYKKINNNIDKYAIEGYLTKYSDFNNDKIELESFENSLNRVKLNDKTIKCLFVMVHYKLGSPNLRLALQLLLNAQATELVHEEDVFKDLFILTTRRFVQKDQNIIYHYLNSYDYATINNMYIDEFKKESLLKLQFKSIEQLYKLLEPNKNQFHSHPIFIGITNLLDYYETEYNIIYTQMISTMKDLDKIAISKYHSKDATSIIDMLSDDAITKLMEYKYYKHYSPSLLKHVNTILQLQLKYRFIVEITKCTDVDYKRITRYMAANNNQESLELSIASRHILNHFYKQNLDYATHPIMVKLYRILDTNLL